MFKRINASLLALVIALAVFVLSGKQSEQVAKAAPAASYELLSALPSSDFIVYVDTQRVLTDVLPAILIENAEARARIESELEKFKKHAGFDPRLLDAIAFGLNFNSQKAPDATFALIARGRFDANAAIETGLSAASNESRGELERRTQVYEGRTIHLLAPTRRTPVRPGASDYSESAPSRQAMVFVALDSNTVAFGNLRSVRATIDASLGRGRVNDELVQLATRTPNAVACFSGNVTPDMPTSFRLGNAKVDKSIASMKQIYGSFTTAGNDAEFLVNIRMDADDDARQLSMALNAMKYIAKLAGDDASDKRKSIDVMIRNLDIYTVGNEVQMILKVSQTDLAPFVPRL